MKNLRLSALPAARYPLLLLGCAGTLAASAADREPVPAVPIPAQPLAAISSGTDSLPEGLYADYQENRGWRWSYARRMPDGCSKLLFSSDAVTVEGATVTIHLRTYQSDARCPEPSRMAGLTGRIRMPAQASSAVYLDGGQVHPQP